MLYITPLMYKLSLRIAKISNPIHTRAIAKLFMSNSHNNNLNTTSAEILAKLPNSGDIDPETGEAFTKSKLKKLKKIIEAKQKKEQKSLLAQEKREKEELFKKEQKSAEGFAEIKENPDLETAIMIKSVDAHKYIGKRVKVNGWVDTLRAQGALAFILLRDCSDFKHRLQCLLSGDLLKTRDALDLSRECSVELKGVVVKDDRAENGVELSVDFWKLIGKSSGQFTSLVEDETNKALAMDQRHLFLRKKETAQIFKMRSLIVNEFRKKLFGEEFIEVTPPTLVQTQVEGGSTLFNVDYFGTPAYLTQSSQLYLETCIFSLGNVFCIVPSYRAEKTRTRRHVCEYTHLESELPFIDYNDLLNHIEDLVVSVSEAVAENHPGLLKELNPNFKVPQKPFKRMNHSEAIDFCNQNNIYKDSETKQKFEYGDDITELPEREMTDLIGTPIFLCRFPTEMKPFYMQRCSFDETLTDSVDLLVPGVGEIVGGSMRESSYERLMAGFKEKGLDTKNYYWYTDLRKYGTVPHGGYGLGLERFLCWILGRDHIRDVCLYPRFTNRCTP